MVFRVIITGKIFVLCTLHVSRNSGFLSLWKHSICSHLCICCRRESQNPIITMASSLNPWVTLNPPEVSENLALKKTAGLAIAKKKKPFAPLLPTELVECILTETKQVCQDLGRQNYPFTDNKQICSWAIESHNRNIYCLLSSFQWVEWSVRSYCFNIREKAFFFFFFEHVCRYACNNTSDYETAILTRFL